MTMEQREGVVKELHRFARCSKAELAPHLGDGDGDGDRDGERAGRGVRCSGWERLALINMKRSVRKSPFLPSGLTDTTKWA